MTAPTTTTKAKRKADDVDDDDHRLKPAHRFHDIGPAIAEADFQPRAVQKDPLAELTAIFVRLGRDYGGMISPPPEEPRC